MPSMKPRKKKRPRWAHSPLRHGSHWSNFLHFTRAKTMRRTQSLEIVCRVVYQISTLLWALICKYLRASNTILCLFFRGRADLASTPYCRPAPKSHAGNSNFSAKPTPTICKLWAIPSEVYGWTCYADGSAPLADSATARVPSPQPPPHAEISCRILD